MISRRHFLAGSALASLYGMTSPAWAKSSVPWRNWSGGQIAYPAGRFSPASEEALSDYLSTSGGAIRPVGSGHSFTPLIPTDGHLVVIDQLTGLIDHSTESMSATFGAGTRLGDMGEPLERIGQAMFNLPDIDRQTLAGATATATHGTGISFPCLSAYISALRLITSEGKVLDLEEGDETFHAAQVSLGALGIVTRMTIKNRPPYKLKAINTVERIEDVLTRFDEAAASHRHFEMFPLTHSDYALVLAIDETDEPINNPPPSPEEQAALGQVMAMWSIIPPKARLPLVNGLAEQIQPSEVVDQSYKILSNIRNNRFNEMEYSVPLHAGADCLREILHTIIDQEVDVVFPLEYRYVRRDDTWLGMSSGDEDHAAISIHRTASEDYRPYFDLIEPIFWKYGGRPHWGKIHALSATELSKLYPRFSDFQNLRHQLDPKGRLLNDHLRRILGA